MINIIMETLPTNPKAIARQPEQQSSTHPKSSEFANALTEMAASKNAGPAFGAVATPPKHFEHYLSDGSTDQVISRDTNVEAWETVEQLSAVNVDQAIEIGGTSLADSSSTEASGLDVVHDTAFSAEEQRTLSMVYDGYRHSGTEPGRWLQPMTIDQTHGAAVSTIATAHITMAPEVTDSLTAQTAGMADKPRMMSSVGEQGSLLSDQGGYKFSGTPTLNPVQTVAANPLNSPEHNPSALGAIVSSPDSARDLYGQYLDVESVSALLPDAGSLSDHTTTLSAGSITSPLLYELPLQDRSSVPTSLKANTFDGIASHMGLAGGPDALNLESESLDVFSPDGDRMPALRASIPNNGALTEPSQHDRSLVASSGLASASASSEASLGRSALTMNAVEVTAKEPQAFASSMATHLRVIKSQGGSEAKVNLHPAELGRMSVSIITEGSETKIAFTVETAQARQLVEGSLPRLREMLEQAGLSLTESDVSERDHRSSSESEAQQTRNRGQSLTDETATPDEKLLVSVRLDPNHLLDIFA